MIAGSLKQRLQSILVEKKFIKNLTYYQSIKT
jgi:hypothetical protein